MFYNVITSGRATIPQHVGGGDGHGCLRLTQQHQSPERRSGGAPQIATDAVQHHVPHDV